MSRLYFAQKKGRVFICRLFQRSYCDEYSSLENTIQWTFLLFVWLPALFPLHLLYWLYCDVRTQISAALSGAFSGSTICFLNYCSLRNLPLNSFPLLSDRCDNPKEDCSILIPILHLSGFRFQFLSGFYSSGEFIHQSCDLSKYPMPWFITSLCVLNCGTYSIVTDWWSLD